MKGYKYRIFPTEEQSQLIDLTISHCRYVWNGFLALKEFRYNEFWEKLNYSDMSKFLTEIKKTDNFLNDVDAVALQQTLRQLDDTYKRFFKGLCKYPKFKSKKNPKNSYKTMKIKVEDDRIKIPKIGWLQFANSRDISGRIMSATISKTPTNKYYISLTVDEAIEKLKPIDKEIGIDLGLKTFVVCSDGIEIKAHKPLWKYSARLKKLQRKRMV